MYRSRIRYGCTHYGCTHYGCTYYTCTYYTWSHCEYTHYRYTHYTCTHYARRAHYGCAKGTHYGYPKNKDLQKGKFGEILVEK